MFTFEKTRLQTARELAGLTRLQTANKIGVTLKEFAAWEKGREKPNSVQLAKLALLLGVPRSFFYGSPVAEPDDFFICNRINH